jgi:hypothetical protein
MNAIALAKNFNYEKRGRRVSRSTFVSFHSRAIATSLSFASALALDLKLATKVFRQLLPDFVQTVENVKFETSPGRKDDKYLGDRSAVDCALMVRTPAGETGIVFCEVKYSEDLSQSLPPTRWAKPRYESALKEVRLYKNPDSPLLRSAPIEQLTREHMVSQLAVDNGVCERAVFIAVAPRLNRRCSAAFTIYANELLPLDGSDRTRAPFQHFTLEAFIDAIDVAGDQTTADRLWQRYCNFQRIYDAALAVLAPKLRPEAATNAASAAASAYARVRGTRGGRRQTNVVAAEATDAVEASAHG